MNILGKKDKKLHAALELMENKNITSLRKKIKILVVDDESDDIYKILGERKYNVYYKSDMNYSIEAEPFEIVIMDIKGVAKRIQSSMEGFALACEIKNKYPLKRVCCYSGSTANSAIAEKLADKKIDAFLVKDMEMDKLCEKIDVLIQDYADYKKQWEILREQLKAFGVEDKDIDSIRNAYYKGFEKGDLGSLNTTIVDILKNGTKVLEITSAIISLMKVWVPLP